jgi:5-oxoprolinase (ATP-hydrolysing)/N-methylhydantoinase A
VRLRKLADDGLTTLVSVYPEGVSNPPDGLYGGAPGAVARGVVRDAAGAVVKDCGTGELVQVTRADEIVEVVLAGGAGFGPPGERARDALARDLANGTVTPEGVRRDYGQDPAAAAAPSTVAAE